MLAILLPTVCSPSNFDLFLWKAASLTTSRFGHVWSSGNRCLPQNEVLQNEQSPTIRNETLEHLSVVEMKNPHLFLGAPPFNLNTRPTVAPSTRPKASKLSEFINCLPLKTNL